MRTIFNLSLADIALNIDGRPLCQCRVYGALTSGQRLPIERGSLVRIVDHPTAPVLIVDVALHGDSGTSAIVEWGPYREDRHG